MDARAADQGRPRRKSPHWAHGALDAPRRRLPAVLVTFLTLLFVLLLAFVLTALFAALGALLAAFGAALSMLWFNRVL